MKFAKLPLLSLSLILLLLALACRVSARVTPTLDPDQVSTLVSVQLTETAMVAPSSATPTETPPTNPTPPVTGSLTGRLSYPSEAIPPLRVVAFNLSDGSYYYVETILNQPTYRIDNLPVGSYHVVAYTQASPGLAGGYTQAVACGLSVDCTNHNLMDVQVAPGGVTEGIDPADWYGPGNNFPPDPLAAPTLGTGSISGALSYPSEGIPPLKVVAFNVQSGEVFSVTTSANQIAYTIERLPAGIYHVVAYTLEGAFSGGYSQAVLCGLSNQCTDHSLIDVVVGEGQAVNGINPADWYAPAGSFPPMPQL